MDDGFFRRDGDLFVPSDYCRGPWNRESLHGRVISGLLGWAVEQYADDDDWHISRLTVDMYRLAPHAPVTLRSELLRSGNRVRLVECTLTVDGVDAAHATGLMLRRSGHADTTFAGEVAFPAPEPSPAAQLPSEPHGDHRDAWEMQRVEHEHPPFTWMRMAPAFIAGIETSPFVRAAASADLTSPISNLSEPRSAFINGDLTVHLQRYPEGEWIGFQPAYHESVAGVAIGSCRLFDTRGLIGLGTVSAVANDRERARASTPTVR